MLIEREEFNSIPKINIPVPEKEYLDNIFKLDNELFNYFKSKCVYDFELTRQLVSFQANKNRPFYRWYKYKEGFSAELVTKYINKHGYSNKIKLLDPFAGSGTALFAASDLGFDSVGIELLPIGREIIETRNILVSNFDNEKFNRIKYWANNKPWNSHDFQKSFNILKITNGAYSLETEEKIKKYLSCMESEDQEVQKVLRLALLCILEQISYTRKDGQYLRWDQRSGRCLGSRPFDKGVIYSFDKAIELKLNEILSDSLYQDTESLFEEVSKIEKPGNIKIVGGSCLNELPLMSAEEYDIIITSPPYCNRYDYTRTYALELALLGINEKELIDLRQTMLSCTVENKQKDLLQINSKWHEALDLLNNHELLQLILEYLEYKKENKTINNSGLPRMIRGYFYEMACVIYELFRVLKKDGLLVMVNDNVRYAGASLSVDLILSDIAEKIGFQIERISILPNGKGNSSQQMGLHGRDQLRKCVYIWRKN